MRSNDQVNDAYRNSGYEVEIDTVRLIKAYLKKWWIIILAGIFAAGIFYVAQSKDHNVTYKDTDTLYINIYALSTDETKQRQPDIPSLAYVAVSDPVMEMAAGKLDFDITPEELGKKITAVNVDKTYIIKITATDTDKERVGKILSAVTGSFSEYLQEEFEVPAPTLVETGDISSSDVRVNKKNLALAFIVGVILAIIAISVLIIVKDPVASEEDVERRLKLRCLGRDIRKGSGKGYSAGFLADDIRSFCGEKKSIVITDINSKDEKQKVTGELIDIYSGNGRDVKMIPACTEAGGSGAMTDEELCGLILKEKAERDYLIIDAPSLNESRDARTVGRLSDGVIIVLKKNRISCRSVLRSTEDLTDAGCIIIGVVLV